MFGIGGIGNIDFSALNALYGPQTTPLTGGPAVPAGVASNTPPTSGTGLVNTQVTTGAPAGAYPQGQDVNTGYWFMVDPNMTGGGGFADGIQDITQIGNPANAIRVTEEDYNARRRPEGFDMPITAAAIPAYTPNPYLDKATYDQAIQNVLDLNTTNYQDFQDQGAASSYVDPYASAATTVGTGVADTAVADMTNAVNGDTVADTVVGTDDVTTFSEEDARLLPLAEAQGMTLPEYKAWVASLDIPNYNYPGTTGGASLDTSDYSGITNEIATDTAVGDMTNAVNGGDTTGAADTTGTAGAADEMSIDEILAYYENLAAQEATAKQAAIDQANAMAGQYTLTGPSIGYNPYESGQYVSSPYGTTGAPTAADMGGLTTIPVPATYTPYKAPGTT